MAHVHLEILILARDMGGQSRYQNRQNFSISPKPRRVTYHFEGIEKSGHPSYSRFYSLSCFSHSVWVSLYFKIISRRIYVVLMYYVSDLNFEPPFAGYSSHKVLAKNFNFAAF